MKKVVVFVFLMIILASISMSCVDRKYYIVSYQIINVDTYNIISEGSLHVGEEIGKTLSNFAIENYVSTQLGFTYTESNSGLSLGARTWTRTVDDINQRLLFIEIKKYIEYKKFSDTL